MSPPVSDWFGRAHALAPGEGVDLVYGRDFDANEVELLELPDDLLAKVQSGEEELCFKGGPDDEAWCITPVADALRKLASANPAHTMCTYEMRQTRDEVGGRTNTGVRREPLGVDRTGTRYYDIEEKDED